MSALPDALRGLRDLLGARRLVVWEVDADAGGAAPLAGSGELPPRQPAGTPLAWSAAERQVLRLDPRPRWAVADVVAIPLGDPCVAVLTIETEHAHETFDRAAIAASIVGPLLALDQAERRARTSDARFQGATVFLAELAREADAGRMPERLADVAREATGADGLLLASWDGGEGRGRVVARSGRGGGAPVGAEFEADDGELGLAARTGVALRRGPGDETRPLVAAGADARGRAPADLAIIPLLEPPDRVRGGVLACWSTTPLEDEALDLIRALGPLLGLQLRSSLDLARFRQEAGHDALTGLPNRAALEERLRTHGGHFDRYRRPFALLVLDIDRFKAINDTLGHPAGDAVLVHLAHVLRSALREVDVPARMGGEEFVVVLPETLVHQAADVAERVRRAVEASPAVWEGRTIPVTVSVGVSGCPESTDEPDRMLALADQALYAAKEGGRNRVVVATRGGTVGTPEGFE